VFCGDLMKISRNNFTLSLNVSSSSEKLIFPTDLNKFLYDYNHSKFIECNRKYAEESRRYKQNQGEKYQSEDIQKLKARHGLNHVKSVLEGLRKNYWLAAGTLLGTLNFLLFKFGLSKYKYF
jgi:hypothetical protein